MVGTSRSTELFGRDEAVARLSAALDATKAGRPRHVLVTGEAGVGKSRLLSGAAAYAEAIGARTLLGHCVALGDSGLAYAPYGEIAQALIDEEGAPRMRALAGQAADDLARLVPSLGLARTSGGQPAYAETRLYQAMAQLFRRLAERTPVVIQIEDLQWADPGTLAATSFLAHTLSSTSVAIVASYRSDDGTRATRLRAWLAEATRNDHFERLELEPLDLTATSLLVDSLTTDKLAAREIEEIHRRADGNPFFIEQLLAARDDLGSEVPARLRDVLLARVDALHGAARSLIRTAAVGGLEVGHDALVRVSGQPGDGAERRLRELVDAALLVPTVVTAGEPRYAFRHALLQEAVYGSLLPTERQRLHHDWAEVLVTDAQDTGRSARLAAAVAHHRREARDPEALAASIAAGDVAMSDYAFAIAAGEYEAALRLWPADVPTGDGPDHVDLLVRLGRAAYYAKRDREAVAAFEAAIAEADDDGRRSLINGRLGRALWAMGEWASATAAYEEALRTAPDTPPEAMIRALAGLAQTYMANGQYRRSLPLAEQALARARRAGHRQLEGHVLTTLGMDHAWLGRPEAGRQALEEALAIALELQDPDDVGRAYVCRVETLPLGGQTDEALEIAREGLDVANRMGTMLSYGPYLHVAATYTAFQAGRWELARRHLELADRLVPPVEMGPYRACHVLHPLAEWGDPRAIEVWDDARHRMKELPPSNYLVYLLTGGVVLAAFDDRFDEAADIAEEAIAIAGKADAAIRASELARITAWPIAEIGRRARIEGREDAFAQARATMTRLRELGERSVRDLGAPAGALGRRLELDRAQIEAERHRMLGRSMVTHWLPIADGWLQAGRPHRSIYPRWRAAEAAAAAGDRAVAIDLLRSAHAAASAMGAGPMVARADRMARRLRARLAEPGHPARSATRGGAYGLTPRELEVLAQLVAGKTNQAIADALYITKSTAGVHVSNILAKLDVTTRAGAAELATREEIV